MKKIYKKKKEEHQKREVNTKEAKSKDRDNKDKKEGRNNDKFCHITFEPYERPIYSHINCSIAAWGADMDCVCTRFHHSHSY
jgi:hypothetical protein